MALRQSVIDAHKKSLERFYDLLTPEQRKGETKEQYVERESKEWAERTERLLEEEANEELVNITTGKVIGKRKDIPGAL